MPHSNKQPNLLFVFADQMRGMDMGCAGNPQVITPTLDRLSSEGTRFSCAYANSPVCTPSRATLLTGQFPLTHQVIANDIPMSPDTQTIGEILKAAGYRTGYIGKWHLDGAPRNCFTPPGPRRHGFDFWAVYNCSHNYMKAAYYRDSPDLIAIEGYEPIKQTDLALEFFSEWNSKQAQSGQQHPFALFLSWGPPHDPYHMAPQEYQQLYDPAEIQLRPNARPIQPGPHDISRGLDPQKTLANYYAHITALDQQFKRLLDALEEMSLTEDTIVVFTSDHGDMLWSQGMMKKQQPWEESINIPLIMRWPRVIPAGRQERGLVSVVDLAPTLLSLIGIKIPRNMQGRDLSELALGKEDAERPDSVFIMDLVLVDENVRQGLPVWRGVRTQRYTYVRRVGDANPWLLYDNLEDPFQLCNLVDDPKYRSLIGELDHLLSEWLQYAGDSFRSGEAHLRELGLVELWNARERQMHGEKARLVNA